MLKWIDGVVSLGIFFIFYYFRFSVLTGPGSFCCVMEDIWIVYLHKRFKNYPFSEMSLFRYSFCELFWGGSQNTMTLNSETRYEMTKKE